LIYIIGVPSHEIVHLKAALHQSRNYIKSDFKLHVSRYSSISDHCSTFALSDPLDADWQEVCDHTHEQRLVYIDTKIYFGVRVRMRIGIRIRLRL
jgi:hypothetical protein